jgi:hypothetical protein
LAEERNRGLIVSLIFVCYASMLRCQWNGS